MDARRAVKWFAARGNEKFSSVGKTRLPFWFVLTNRDAASAIWEGLVAKETGSFSGHESFPLRYGWPKKCVDAVAARPDVFAHDDAMVVLGVGKNMVKAIRHWGLATRVVEVDPETTSGDLRVSPIGALVFGTDGFDPYLEDPRTPWLLHWLLSTHREKATTWAWAFGSLDRRAFSREDFLRELVAAGISSRATKGSLARDVEVFFRTYVPARAARTVAVEDTLDCPLVELRLLREEGDGRYEFVRGLKPSLDDATFGFAVLEFWRRVAPDRETLSFGELLDKPGSPGRVFKLDERALVERLEAAESWSRGALLHDDTAGVRQLLRKKRVDPLAHLANELRRGRAA